MIDAGATFDVTVSGTELIELRRALSARLLDLDRRIKHRSNAPLPERMSVQDREMELRELRASRSASTELHARVVRLSSEYREQIQTD